MLGSVSGIENTAGIDEISHLGLKCSIYRILVISGITVFKFSIWRGTCISSDIQS